MKRLLAIALSLLLLVTCPAMAAPGREGQTALWLRREDSAPLCLLKIIYGADGATALSDLIPGTALHRAVPEAANGEGETPYEDGIQRIRTLSRPYVREVADFVEQVQQGVTFSEDYSAMSIQVTAQQLNGLAQRLAELLRADGALADWLEERLQRLDARLTAPREYTGRDLLRALANAMERGQADDERVLAVLRTQSRENGAGTVEFCVSQRTLFAYDTSEEGKTLTLLPGSALEISMQVTPKDETDGDLAEGSADIDIALLGRHIALSLERDETAASLPEDMEVLNGDALSPEDIVRLLREAWSNRNLAF
ncbi:MAG: hypothetical protein IJ157_08275 [Clostridia bacterium]|nr:hypothetical protein [Clostridia bacterium]